MTAFPPPIRMAAALAILCASAACAGSPATPASPASPTTPAAPPATATVPDGTASTAAPAVPATPAARPAAAPAVIVQPGAPGEATRSFDTDDLSALEGVEYTDADIRFMQGMIPHHAQALEMTALVEERTQSKSFRQLTLRMEISQRDEIQLMESWLVHRGLPVRMVMDHHEGMAHREGMPMMPGMLTPAQMDNLRAANGVQFERLFLEYMIQHHQGAITMVRDLFNRSGGQESEVFQFASHVDADQNMEIQRMRAMLEARR